MNSTITSIANNTGISISEIKDILSNAGIDPEIKVLTHEDEKKLTVHIAELALKNAASMTNSAQQKTAVEEKAKVLWKNDAELRAEFRNDFGSYLAYEQAFASGRIRICGTPLE